MATQAQPITEAEILSAVIAPDQPTWPPELARLVLGLQFSAEQIRRMNDLARRNNAGELGDEERGELASYVQVGNFLSLAHSKARISLKPSGD
ncbi:MAG TPA: hypothetical protein VJ783_26245 [Pirellulales bacterium]|nr:hypothetical protein [Pirellulales bacterium]